MTMRLRLARLFTIKTRTEALLLTYAIAVGAVERGMHYMSAYPGQAGWVLALACLGVPFVAGAKLIDSVKPQAVPAETPLRVEATPAPSFGLVPASHLRRHRAPRFSRSRPISGRTDRGSILRSPRRKD